MTSYVGVVLEMSCYIRLPLLQTHTTAPSDSTLYLIKLNIASSYLFNGYYWLYSKITKEINIIDIYKRDARMLGFNEK